MSILRAQDISLTFSITLTWIVGGEKGSWGKCSRPIRLINGYESVVDSPKFVNVGMPTTPITIVTTKMRTEGSPSCVHDL